MNKTTKFDKSAVYTQEQVNVIKRTIAPNLSNDELTIFIHNCMRTGLDPFAKQIYAIKRRNKHGPDSMCIQTGIDGFRLIAERTGLYSPGKDTEFLYNDKGHLLGAKVYVKKQTKDGTWHDISAVALMAEYNPGKAIWKTMPHVMIEKCAEARALRRAFPADLSGIYTTDEMDQANGDTEPEKPPDEPIISPVTWSKLDEYLNSNEALRNKLKELCRVQDLSQIKTSQLEAVRNYARAYKEAKNDTTKK